MSVDRTYAHIRGFNYQPSYGSTSMENWLYFKADVFELELRRGKHHFPNMNAVRLWLSWDAYMRDPAGFGRHFERALDICSRLGLLVVPVLFNRWHDNTLDCGGIYIDHFMPGWSWVSAREEREACGPFQTYVLDIVGSHADDGRILVWDVCNEPFSYSLPVERMKDIEEAEYRWLEKMYGYCKKALARAPVGVSIHPVHERGGLERIEPISDVLLIHPYFTGTLESFERLLDDYADVARLSGKPLLVTEACWGSLDDQWRSDNIRVTLRELKKRNIGWLVHLLHHSRVADAHGPEYGPVGDPGNLAFINADGSLRPGHGVFNDF